MKLRSRTLGFFILFILIILSLNLSINLICAGVYFSQPESTYNVGETILNSININPLESGPLRIELICKDEKTLVLYDSSPQENIDFELPLTFTHDLKLVGDCYFSAEYFSKIYNSREFEISKTLIVSLNTDSFFAKPGDQIIIEGDAKRLNNVLINGEVKVTIPLLNLFYSIQSNSSENQTGGNSSLENQTNNNLNENSNESFNEDNGIFYGEISDGKFLLNITLAKNIAAGDYKITVLAYEPDIFEERTSEGLAYSNLNIAQTLTKIDLAINEQSLDPGDIIEIKPRLYDQSNVLISQDVSVIIKNENSNRIFEKIVKSENTVKYEIPTNISSGYYEIELTAGSLELIKKFYINKKEIVSFDLKNTSLTIKNIGNLPLEKYPIQINLNGKSFIKKVDLKKGEEIEFKLLGDGEYDVEIFSGENKYSKNGVILTGYATEGVASIKENSLLFLKTPIVWIIFIIILLGGGLFLFRNIFKKKSFAYSVSNKKNQMNNKVENGSKIKQEGVIRKNKDSKELIESQKQDKNPKEITNKKLIQAEKVLVLNGQKNLACIVALKIKNKLSQFAKGELEKLLEKISEKKGAPYRQGDFIFTILSPIITNSFKNELNAVKIAEEILLFLRKHNNKFKDKINFGLGINSGEIINTFNKNKLEFTSLGNFIVIAKNLAEVSNEQILVSEGIYKKNFSEIKTKKSIIDNKEFNELDKIIDRERNKKFIQSFLKRMGEEKA